MASAEFDDESEEKRPTVQVGDPFVEKKLIEACLELMATDAIAAIQDMGAAGLTSSSVEMADKGGIGIKLIMDDVPQREENMTTYEMMLSESQERMLVIMKPGREDVAKAIFEKWELDVAVIGETTDTGRMLLEHKGEIVCDIPVAPLADDAPKYERPYFAPEVRAQINAKDVAKPSHMGEVLLKLMSSPNMASKAWIWRQYDRHVMADTAASSEDPSDAAIVRVHGTNKALAITADCTPRYCYADPFEGGKQAVAEAWRNLTATGADPIAITDCLNFGNPEREEIMGQFVGCVEGMAQACASLNFPVVSGNVSLYNETNGVAIPPTPAVGGVGLIQDMDKRAGFGGMCEGHILMVVGKTTGTMGASTYLRVIEDREDGGAPMIDLDREKANGNFVRGQIRAGRISACHDLSDGGLACAAADMALASKTGIKLAHDADSDVPMHGFLFGEDQARYLLAAKKDDAIAIIQDAKAEDIDIQVVGLAGGAAVSVNGAHHLELDRLRSAWEGWLPELMEPAAEAAE